LNPSWRTLPEAKYEVLLDALPSTYFESKINPSDRPTCGRNFNTPGELQNSGSRADRVPETAETRSATTQSPSPRRLYIGVPSSEQLINLARISNSASLPACSAAGPKSSPGAYPFTGLISGRFPHRLLPVSPRTSNTMNPQPFRFLDCFRLCIPALLLGAFLRISFLAAIPEAHYSADAGSYFEAADYRWNRHKTKFNEKRRWLYPILLLAAPALPGSSAQAVAVTQHAVGLAAVLAAGWIVGNVTQRRRLWVPLVTVIVAALPQALWFEHETVAECFFVACFMLTTALAVPHNRLRTPTGLAAFLAAAAVIVLLKPHGKIIWLGCLLTALWIWRAPRKWGLAAGTALALGGFALVTTGEKKQSAWLFLASTLPLVDPEGDSHREYRQTLKPLIQEVAPLLDQYPWKEGDYKKRLRKPEPDAVSPLWGQLAADRERYSQVANAFAREAVLQHPIQFAQLVLAKIGLGLSGADYGSKFEPRVFWEMQSEMDASRWTEPGRPAELELYYGWNADLYPKLVAERGQRPPWAGRQVSKLATWLAPIRNIESDSGPNRLAMTPFGWLVLAGLALCLVPSLFTSLLPLWLPAALYLIGVYAVGDSLPRYALPVEWLLPIFAALFLDRLLSALQKLLPTRKPAPSGQS
jgi:hypothetical protein